jgi:hypothetical protein
MAIGIIITISGLCCYIIYMILFNFYLRKNDPEALTHPKKAAGGQKGKISLRMVKPDLTPDRIDLLLVILKGDSF